jgi:hypothetical protein
MMRPATEDAISRSNENDHAEAPEGTGQRRAVRLWTAALILLCIAALVLLFRHIERTLPYPYHIDEGFISGPASHILVTGELHPQRFTYPSLPTYLAATAMAVGFLRGATHLEIRDINRLGQVGYPYYETPRAMQTARQAFALLSVICLAMTGLSAWIAFRKPATILLAPLLLLASPLFFRHSWTYLNVDIVGVSFVMLTLAACLLGTTHPSIQQSAVVPGVFAGLATGSKYTLAIVALPVLLALGLYFPRARIISACVAALAAMLVAFLAAVPYSLIDIPGFLNGVAYEAFHYASGHAGFAGEPGLPQLLYYLRHFLSEFGYGAALLAVLGVFLFSRADWRRAAVVTMFPAGLLWLLSSQRVHFTRNALAIHPFVAMFAAFGFVALHDWIVKVATRRGLAPKRLKVPVLAGLVLVIATVPFWHFVEHLRDRTDSRNLARVWVAEHLPYNWAVVVPSELGFDRRGLEIRGRHLKVVDLSSARDPGALDALLSDVPSPAVILVPRWGADRRSPGQQAADALNALARQWRVLQTFGTNDVLVNYSSSTAWGDPAFAIAILR